MILQSLLGGALIGLAAALLLVFNGRIMGASGIASTFVLGIGGRFFGSRMARFELAWRGLFLAGLLTGAAVLRFMNNENYIPSPPQASYATLVVSGILVGIGTRIGMGCTSGHGVCGIGRLSGRSFIATSIFMLTAMLIVYLTK